MSDDTEGFSLMVHVPADQWANANRRVIYLEAALIQLLQDRERIQEWYDAGELSALRLTGLPTGKGAITRMANAAKWVRRPLSGYGGKRYEYHFTSFPKRAFDDLINRILNIPEPEDMPVKRRAPDVAPAPAIPCPEVDNMAPPWVLPFMRLLKAGPKGDLSAAWKALPAHMPPGVLLPTAEEAAEVIVRLDLAK